MRKFLVCDVDRSLATIGGSKGAAELSGFPPIPISAGISQVQQIMEKMFSLEVGEEAHPLFDFKIPVWKATPSDLVVKNGLEGLVIDTISHTFNQDKRILEAKRQSKALEMADWGTLEKLYAKFGEYMKNLPIWVIVNCHITYDKDQNSGAFYFAPQVSGQTRDNLAQYFDVVLYTKASRDGKKNYTWQTYADASRFGKDRLSILEPIVTQDFSVILDGYKNAGAAPPKILVIGESGTGKTRALATINKKGK